MDTNEKKNVSKLSYETKFMIILAIAIVGIVLIYFGMEYCFEKVAPKNNAAPVTQSSGQNTTVIEE